MLNVQCLLRIRRQQIDATTQVTNSNLIQHEIPPSITSRSSRDPNLVKQDIYIRPTRKRREREPEYNCSTTVSIPNQLVDYAVISLATVTASGRWPLSRARRASSRFLTHVRFARYLIKSKMRLNISARHGANDRKIRRISGCGPVVAPMFINCSVHSNHVCSTM